MRRDPLSGDIYVFINKGGHVMKCLIWDRNGYVIVAKRLEKGRFVTSQKELTETTFSLLFDGIKLGAKEEKMV
jgi:transposase